MSNYYSSNYDKFETRDTVNAMSKALGFLAIIAVGVGMVFAGYGLYDLGVWDHIANWFTADYSDNNVLDIATKVGIGAGIGAAGVIAIGTATLTATSLYNAAVDLASPKPPRQQIIPKYQQQAPQYQQQAPKYQQQAPKYQQQVLQQQDHDRDRDRDRDREGGAAI